MQCDMCGTNKDLVNAEIEGTVLAVCAQCAKFGKIITIAKPIQIQRKTKPILRRRTTEIIESIIPNYYQLIRNARERKGLTQEEAAKQLSEKESLYHKIEKGQLKPSLALAKKLEKFFKIKIIEEIKEKDLSYTPQKGPASNSGLTIGDMIKKAN